MKINENMCSWNKGNISEFDIWPGWHDDVLQSTGLRQRDKNDKLPDIDDLPDYVQKIIHESIPLYEEMFDNRTRGEPVKRSYNFFCQ